jgi:hypothetical protein
LQYSGGEYLTRLKAQISNNEEQLKYATTLEASVKIQKEINGLKKQLESAEKEIEEKADQDVKVLKDLDYQTKMMKAKGSSDLDILLYKKKVYTTQLQDTKNQAELLKNLDVDIVKETREKNEKTKENSAKINENQIELDKQLVLSKENSKAKKLAAERDYYVKLKEELERQISLITGNSEKEVLNKQELQKRLNDVNKEITEDNKQIARQWTTDLSDMAEYMDKTFNQMAGNLSKAAGSFYKIAQDKAKKELSVEKEKRKKQLDTEEDERLSRAFTEEQKDRIKKEYATKQENLDNEIQEKQKQAGIGEFKFKQAMDVGQAIMNTATGVTNALKVEPPWVGIALAGTVGLMGAGEVAAIKAQEVQGYFGGGKIPGDQQIIKVNELGEEFIVNAESTKKYLPILEAINTNRFKTELYTERSLSYNYKNTDISNNNLLIKEIVLLRQEVRKSGAKNAEIMKQDKNVFIGKTATKAIVAGGDYELKREFL